MNVLTHLHNMDPRKIWGVKTILSSNSVSRVILGYI